MSGFVDAIRWIQAQAANLPDLNHAPAYPPEASMKFPLSVCYLNAITATRHTASLTRTLGTIRWELHVARTDVPRDIERVTDLGLAAYQLILDDVTLGGNVSAIPADQIVGNLVTLQYATTSTICWRFDIQAKVMGT